MDDVKSRCEPLGNQLCEPGVVDMTREVSSLDVPVPEAGDRDQDGQSECTPFVLAKKWHHAVKCATFFRHVNLKSAPDSAKELPKILLSACASATEDSALSRSKEDENTDCTSYSSLKPGLR